MYIRPISRKQKGGNSRARRRSILRVHETTIYIYLMITPETVKHMHKKKYNLDEALAGNKKAFWIVKARKSFTKRISLSIQHETSMDYLSWLKIHQGN